MTLTESNRTPNDLIIAKATKWSLLFSLMIAIGGGISIWVWTRPSPQPPPAATIAVPPAPKPVATETPRGLFTDITQAAGIHFVHTNGAAGEKLLPESMGGGCAFLDYDGDGDQDILFVNSTAWPDDESGSKPPATELYRNDGSGHFKPIAASCGLDVTMYGTGVAAADYDNDGDTDVFITAVGPNRLFRNDDGHFKDVTDEAGLAKGEPQWSTGTGFFDCDNDGDLDLFVCNYVRWTRQIDIALDYRMDGIGRAYGPPMDFEGTFSSLYRNNGDGTFTDVSAVAGIEVETVQGRPMGKALGLCVIDIDGDGYLDVVVANDTVRNFFFHNRRDGTFKERGRELGIAYDSYGQATGAMGIDAGHYRGDESLGILVGNFAQEMTSLFLSQDSRVSYADQAISEGIGAATRLALTWSLFLFDFDLDGRLDLLQTNGHLEDQIHLVQPSQRYRQSAQLFWNTGDQPVFAQVIPDRTGGLNKPIVGRGGTYADIDGDGDLDVLLTQTGGAPLLLRNDQQQGHHWLRCKLTSRTTNRDAIGAQIVLAAGGVAQRRWVRPTRGYLSAVELPVTFGLGRRATIDSLRVIWPDGSLQDVEPPAVDQLVVIEDDRAYAEPLKRIAKVHLDHGKGAMAIEPLSDLLERDPSNLVAARNLARAYLQADDPSRALEALGRARQRGDNSTAGLYLTGIALARKSEFQPAAESLQQVVARDPNRAAPHFQLGRAQVAIGERQAAVAAFEKTLQIDPIHRGAMSELANEAQRAGDTEKHHALTQQLLRLRRLFGEPASAQADLESCVYTQAEVERK